MDVDVAFDGSNWEDLTRLVTLANLYILQNADDYDDNEPAKCALLASKFRGPALDWVGNTYAANTRLMTSFDGFVTAVRNAFGVSEDGLRAQRRGQLEGLLWQADLPVFFAEFDRLTHQLGVDQNATRIALLRAKLPTHVQKLLSEQALDFHDYDTMRERLLTMWSLDPSRRISQGHGPPIISKTPNKRPRCGRCGKRGHVAADCRSKK